MRADRRKRAHMCAANKGRAIPETEKPPAMAGGTLFYKKCVWKWKKW